MGEKFGEVVGKFGGLGHLGEKLGRKRVIGERSPAGG
jgi:hypothetical protein